MNSIARKTQVKQISSYSKRTGPQSQQSQPRRSKQSRPHGHPQPSRYQPPSRPRTTRYALDIGRNLALTLTLERHRITSNAATLAKIGGKDE